MRLTVAVQTRNALNLAFCILITGSGLAQGPGPCSDPPTLCISTNRCAPGTATTCTVTLAKNGGSATATPDLAGVSANNLFCLAPNKVLKFKTVGGSKTFIVTFSASHPPSPSVTGPLRGSSSNPVSITPTVKACYKYSIEVCESPGSCGST